MSATMETEEDVLKFWEEKDIFQRSMENNKDGPHFVFYDGPPFATGLPHYGHIVASTLKDVIPRYMTQMGFYVPRKWGWDCHGLPIEYEIEKKLGIKTGDEVEKFGIANYNEECRQIVLMYREEWRKTVKRLGRWVDFENDYKTMDPSFMESVWWVIRQLFDQGRIYRSVKVMPYSTGCHTPLSNFEAKSNYKEVKDPSIVVKFKVLLAGENAELYGENVYFLVWTTTPWTLISNLAICVNPEMVYQLIEVKNDEKEEGNFYLLSEESVPVYFKGKLVKVVKTFTGSELEGWEYDPLYDYFLDQYPGSFQVVSDSYVKAGNGTGLVHQAPAFGEDDYRVCLARGIISKRERLPPCPIDDNGFFQLEADTRMEISGVYFKDVDPLVLKDLKNRGLLFQNKKEAHEYPFCWRSETPLIYRSVACWFIEVESLQEKLLAHNETIHWVPEFIGQNKFKDWLSRCQDWCFSRNRYWGTPIPIWVSDDGDEMICVGSVAELEQLAGLEPGTVKDLHRHHVDHITIPSKQGKGVLRRIPEVLDCWFESGSMPYAQGHYPFENKEQFEQNFPCDFIAEGSDQTRGWFYTLLVLSTALFDRPAFKNVIVNGMVLAEDGEKMSKRKKNYPAPELVLEQYGADALRLYLINSRLVHADSLKFKESDLRVVVKNVNIMIKNMVQYFLETVEYYEEITQTKWQFQPGVFLSDVSQGEVEVVELSNPLDSWILHCLEDFLIKLHSTMEKYDLNPVLGLIETYIDQLSRWYIKLNKVRFRQLDDLADVQTGLSVLCSSLYHFMVGMAPFTPFMSEIVYHKLKKFIGEEAESVHFLRIPHHDFNYRRDRSMVVSMNYMTKIVNLTRGMRAGREVQSKKMPYGKMIICHPSEEVVSAIQRVQEILLEETNVVEVVYQSNSDAYLNYGLSPNYKILGPKLGKRLKRFRTDLENLSVEEVNLMVNENLREDGFVVWPDNFRETEDDEELFELDAEAFEVTSLLKKGYEEWHTASDADLVLLLDPRITPKLKQNYYCRLFSRGVQDYRRKLGLKLADQVTVAYQCGEGNQYLTPEVITADRDNLEKLVGDLVNGIDSELKSRGQTELELDGEKIQVQISDPK